MPDNSLPASTRQASARSIPGAYRFTDFGSGMAGGEGDAGEAGIRERCIEFHELTVNFSLHCLHLTQAQAAAGQGKIRENWMPKAYSVKTEKKIVQQRPGFTRTGNCWTIFIFHCRRPTRHGRRSNGGCNHHHGARRGVHRRGDHHLDGLRRSCAHRAPGLLPLSSPRAQPGARDVSCPSDQCL